MSNIPPLRLAPPELQIPRPTTESKYWFGDRLLTTKGWGICTGLKKCKALNQWLYYIDLDNTTHPQPFFTKEIIRKHEQNKF
ncbi:MAG: hypothetical protein ACO3YZ_06640 [Candidatus Nanopelagicaceae bacterium]